MSIHSEFWKARQRVPNGFARLRSVRDSNRKRCYDWEFKNLRPSQKVMSREEAKGYARLCAKIAIRTMRETGVIKNDEVAAIVRASFVTAFTTETLKRCDANASGAYFAKWGWTDVIIAHEVAHWADAWAHKLTGAISVGWEGHGPKWRGWFLHLLDQAGMRNTDALSRLLDAKGMPARTMTEAGLAFTLPTAR